jgi:hypothetical protein
MMLDDNNQDDENLNQKRVQELLKRNALNKPQTVDLPKTPK